MFKCSIGVWLGVFAIVVFSSQVFALDGGALWEASHCEPEKKEDAQLYTQDFSWNQTFPELQENAVELYQSEKRLARRAYYEASTGNLVLPYRTISGDTVPVVLPNHFIESMQGQIERALELGYADAINFSDMGHNHFLIPLDFWEMMKDEEGPVRERAVLNNKDVKWLYHTAEQLKMKEDGVRGALIGDPHLQWRYWTRNLLGYNDGSARLDILVNEDANFNSISGVEGYRWHRGIDFNANKNGCLKYTHKGVTHYFDMSFYPLDSDPDVVSDDDDYF